MAWQKNKILLISIEEIKQDDGTVKKVYHRYVIRKSKGKAGSQPKKLVLKKYNPVLRKRVEYKEAKYK
jgi:ribosomal protein L33